MAKEDKKAEDKKPEVKRQPIGQKYIVLEPYKTGSDKLLKEYKRGDLVHYPENVAKQFIKTQTIKKWQK